MIFVIVASGIAIALALVNFNRTFSVPYPAIRSSSDSAVLARGQYLVYGPGHCADCHAPPDQKNRVDSGLITDLSGGYTITTFLGEMRSPNITSDPATGIGGLQDGEIARFFRYGVGHQGQVGLPMMMYADLSDDDLTAMLSYLRTLPPVYHLVSPSHYNILGKITKAYFLKPFAPATEPPLPQIPGLTATYGAYLANTVANCASCHTARNMKTGEYTGPRFAGGMVFHSTNPTGMTVVSPNLTPDSSTGRIVTWSRENFETRMRSGNLNRWSPMPWGPFSRMSAQDIGAIYLYLMQLHPVHKEN